MTHKGPAIPPAAMLVAGRCVSVFLGGSTAHLARLLIDLFGQDAIEAAEKRMNRERGRRSNRRQQR